MGTLGLFWGSFQGGFRMVPGAVGDTASLVRSINFYMSWLAYSNEDSD